MLDGTPSRPPPTGDRAVAAATYTATNAGMAALPLIPGNTMGLGGTEIVMISHGINGLIQACKMHDWFQQDRWAVWVEIGLGIAVCLIVWHAEPARGILNAFGTVGLAINNYGHLNTLGVLPPGS